MSYSNLRLYENRVSNVWMSVVLKLSRSIKWYFFDASVTQAYVKFYPIVLINQMFDVYSVDIQGLWF